MELAMSKAFDMSHKSPYFSKQDETIIWHKGQCHLWKLQFEVEAPKGFVAIRLQGILSLDGTCRETSPHRVIAEILLQLTSLTPKVAKHTFCSVCGIHPFCKYSGILSEIHPRCNPESISVNVRCLNQSLLGTVSIEFLDGKNFSGSLPLVKMAFIFYNKIKRKIWISCLL
eukprot:jgi/Galph1/4666/GphlegSOOS_G3409.1